jgi:hypothetical protein
MMMRSTPLLVLVLLSLTGCFLPRPTQGRRSPAPKPRQQSSQEVWRQKVAALVPMARDEPALLWQGCERDIRRASCSRSEPAATAQCVGTLKKNYFLDSPVGRVALLEQMGCTLDKQQQVASGQR